MQHTVSGNQLLIASEQQEFFKYIKENDIQLNLQVGNNIEKDVLKNKSLDKDRLDITKLANIKQELDSCNSKKVKVKTITFEMECL